MRVYFVFSEDLMLIFTIQKVCNWFRILLTEISMLTKTNICSDWNHLMGNNGANWIPAMGRRSSKRNILWLHTWEITFAQKRRYPNFHTLCKIAMRILTMFGSTYCTYASLSFQIWTSWRTSCASVWQMKTFTTAFVSVSFPWIQSWSNWQEVENAISPTKGTINNAENPVNNHMIYSIGVLIHRQHIIISFHDDFNKNGRHAISV